MAAAINQNAVPLPEILPEQARLRPEALDRLSSFIAGQVEQGRYRGAQVAIARDGKLAFARSFGEAKPGLPAADDTPFLLYSNTKVLTAATLWILAERGALTFTDRVADHVPEFERHGKGDITLTQLLTHQAGFPDASVPAEAYGDHSLLRRAVCDFTLAWAPGTRVVYHGSAAHWTAAVVIEAITGRDFRDVMRELVIEPLGLGNELYIGVPDDVLPRCATMELATETGFQPHPDDNDARKRAGVPGGGGYGSARAMAAFYQALLNGGALNGSRILSPRTLAFALRDVTGDRIADNSGFPMHFALGPYLRGTGQQTGDIGPASSPRTFGHGGVGSSLCWGDPETGVSFAYVSNCRMADPWHLRRMDILSHMVQATIL